MKRQIPMVLLSLGLTTAALSQAPVSPRVANSRFQAVAATAGLEAALRQAGKGPVWVGWTVPVVPGQGYTCCFRQDDDWKNFQRTACLLEGKNQSWGGRGDKKEPADPGLMVLARLEGGEIRKVRGFSASCPLDAGGLRFVWLGGAKPEESVDLLAKTVQGAAKGLADEALATLASHRNARADEALESLASAPHPAKLREDALFWIGQTRGERGARFLIRVLDTDPDVAIREKAVFSLSQSHFPGAADAIIRTAKTNRSPKVRGEALFWLAQMDDAKSPDAILQAIHQDPEAEVRKKGVFALSQLDKGRGVPLLVRLGHETQDREIRKEALFWLAQSQDPAAMKYLDGVLNE